MPEQLTVQNVRDAYLAHWPRISAAALESMTRWPETFAAEMRNATDIGEFKAVLATFESVDAGKEPSFYQIKDRIIRRRQARALANREQDRPALDCPACLGRGYIQVLTTPKPGHGRRLLNPGQAEALPARDIYITIQPCCCPEGERVNSEAMEGCKDPVVPQKPAYRYSREKLHALSGYRVGTHEIPVYRAACERLYRVAHDLAPMPEQPIRAVMDGPISDVVNRVMARLEASHAPLS
jgi:hypothetical protein